MKKNIVLSSLTTALLLSLSTFNANADGLYISGKIGNSTLGHTIERNASTAGLPVTDSHGVTNTEETDVSLGLSLGYKHHISDKIFLGLEGFYNYETAESRNINGVLVTDIELNSTYGSRLLFGSDITDKFSLYVHGGATILDFDVNNSYTFAPPKKSGSEREVAFSYGVGAAYTLHNNFDIFVDYTQINDVGFSGLPEVAGGTGRVSPNEIDLGTLSIGLTYNF
jgi:opacity protein-like surface antigen